MAQRKLSSDGRLLLLVSTDSTGEPRFQISDDPVTQQVFGMDVEGWRPILGGESVGAESSGVKPLCLLYSTV